MLTNGSDVIVFNADKSQVLLCKREDFRIWVIPGGRVEDGESLEDAAVREMYEETGYQIAIDRLVGKYWHPQFPRRDLWHVFEAHIIGGEPGKSFETIDLGFFPVKKFPPRTLSWTREQIMHALSADGHVIERTQNLPVHIAFLLRIGIVLRELRNKYILNHK